MSRLAVCADTLFRHLPFEARVKEIARAGFLVEFWGWQGRDIDAIAADPSVQICTFTGETGGSLVHPDGLEAYLRGVEETLPVAEKLRCRQLVLHSGELNYEGQVIHPIAAHPATMWITAYKGLCQVAELAEKHDVAYNIEHLNTKMDHEGYPLPRPEDVMRLLSEVGSPRIKILLDIYQLQVQEGNLIGVIHDCAETIGYVHVADVPARLELGAGEINFPQIAQALREVGYDGIVGLEAIPQGDPYEAMDRFRQIFS